MIHQEFIDRLERHRKIFEFWSNECQDLTKVAKEFGLAKALVASNAIDYYRRHMNDLMRPDLGRLDHKQVSWLVEFVGHPFRDRVVALFSTDTPLHKRLPRRLAVRQREFIALALDALGLPHCTINGVEFITPNTKA